MYIKKQYTVKTKIRFDDSNVISIFPYKSELWQVVKGNKATIDVVFQRMLVEDL